MNPALLLVVCDDELPSAAPKLKVGAKVEAHVDDEIFCNSPPVDGVEMLPPKFKFEATVTLMVFRSAMEP